MSYNPEIHHRHSIRLKGYDYSQAGLYFITICSQYKIHLFGTIVNNTMMLNDIGKIVDEEWVISEKIRDEIKLHEYIIMPNHLHAIVEIVGANGRSPVHGFALQAKSIGSLMSGFKSSATVRINKMRKSPWQAVWQRNYWEHIIRNENEYFRIAEYIRNNPLKWKNDKLNNGNGNIVLEKRNEYGYEDWMV